MAITYFGSASKPADNAAQAGPGPITVTPPASMTTGDLVVVFLGDRTVGDEQTFRNTTPGGQSWHEVVQLPGAAVSGAIYACRFNGTWSADPGFDQSSGAVTAFSAVMHVIRPTSTSKIMDFDISPVAGTFVAGSGPFTKTIPAITTRNAGAIALAFWMSSDDNTWGSLTGTGWTVAGSAQYRNTTGTQTSIVAAYNVVSSPGTTNNVSLNQATNGGDSGITCIMSFYERDPDFTSIPAVDVFWDGENSTNTTTMTTAIMDAGTHLSSAAGSWVFVGSAANLTVSTSAQKGFGTRQVTVSGTGYTDSSGTRGMRQDHNAQGGIAKYFAWEKTAAANKMSMGFKFRTSIAFLDFESYTLAGIQDAGAAGLSAFNLQNFDSAFHRTNLENADSTLTPGPWLQLNTWYWITIQYDFTNAVARMIIYDDSFVQIGFGCVSTPGAGQQQAKQMRLASFGGGFPSHAYLSDYDDMAGDFTTGAFPLGPANSASGTINSKTVTDNLTIADSLIQTRLRNRLPSDGVALADTGIKVMSLTRQPSDPVTVSDTLIKRMWLTRQMSDAIALSDAMLQSIVRNRLLTDSFSLSDSLIKSITSGGTVNTKLVSDSLSITDTAMDQMLITKLLGDTIAVTEPGLGSQLQHNVGISDTIDVTDAQLKTLRLTRVIGDSITVTDLISATTSSSRVVSVTKTDSIVIVDGTITSAQRMRQIADSLAMNESLLRILALTRQNVDVLTTTDGCVKVRRYSAQINDFVVLDELLSRTILQAVIYDVRIEIGVDQDPIIGVDQDPIIGVDE